MKTHTELVTDYTTITSDSSTANTALGRTWINIAIKRILAMRDWTWNRSYKVYDTVAGQWIYPLPYNAGKIRGVKVTINDVVYYPKEVINEEDWAIISRSSITSDAIQYFFINGNNVELYPTFSSSAEEMQIDFQKIIHNRSASDYSTGTISRSLDSKDVRGTSTTFTWPMVGSWLKVEDENEWYEIIDFTDATHITTGRASRTATDDAGYTISEMIPLPDGYEDIPLYYAAQMYFTRTENPLMAREYKNLYEEGVDSLMRHDAKTTGNILERGITSEIVNINDYPTDIA